ncbi:MAG TPA: TrpR-like protein [Candidatus Intestinimonas pullistercoris]|uniref:TrpR-like protein n=1 Tax=Candidatus Intestinimonas pullistercoris TaxID=2838623 RepID=A0A9D2NZB1_9FIRM|nr:YerC/YecD family TrpR-related protein [uncultured Intestinimonas sp.]HJC41237.1 TrpR-like protein [Candidatus Intestinimonas pullistercoris]
MAKSERKERSLALYETILKLKDVEECCRFFEDLCTPVELRSMEQRFDVAVYLQQGLVYLDILERTGASSATISRVRRSMLDNGAGGVMRDVILRSGLDRPDRESGSPEHKESKE